MQLGYGGDSIKWEWHNPHTPPPPQKKNRCLNTICFYRIPALVFNIKNKILAWSLLNGKWIHKEFSLLCGCFPLWSSAGKVESLSGNEEMLDLGK